MKRLHFLGLICVCLGIAAVLLFRANTNAIAVSQSTCGSWNVVPSPNNNDSSLSGVAAIARNDIWAVGHHNHGSGYNQALIEHWNGRKWSIIPGPNPPLSNNFLNGVTAISPDNVWAVGEAFDYHSNSNEALIEHWDGTTWGIVPSPSLGTNDPRLYGVSAVSATDIWAVGEDDISGLNQSLIEHWDGSQWSIVAGPTHAFTVLYGVTALSTDNVWAVGNDRQSSSLVEHWDGSQWSIVPSPNPSKTIYHKITFSGVAAVSATDIWAVGEYGTRSINYGAALIEHWNGKKWSLVSGAPGRAGAALFAVTVLPPNGIWAVGTSGSPSSTLSLTEHWDGTTWSIVPSPNPGSAGNIFNAAASVPGSNYLWAVGNINFSTGTLTAYYC